MEACYFCNVCKMPMGPNERVLSCIVRFPGESSVKHADEFLCGWLIAFVEHRDRQFLEDAGIVPERIEE
jgi:hypothetical protein